MKWFSRSYMALVFFILYVPIAVMMARAVVIGFARGNITLPKIKNAFAPSIFAASSYPTGRLRKKEYVIKKKLHIKTRKP